ncbi:serine/arginine repetitive matrix protein 1 isoform X2 [Drosophila kikkawai]|uniref:Serine/arginine repetitive matrix protein 1 isoform X2 n=1 Tax=Drosophila kikkawai TaxID=30033 RepID=A0ABM4GCC5_DROKI|nr:uncharacterized protein LOC108081850 isoform X1 [Drosophila kikkawai]
MSEPENNDSLISNVASETCYLDLDYSEIDVENELKSCDCSLIGLEDDSATNISLHVKITKRIEDKETTECLQTCLSESNLPDTANGSTDKEVNCMKAEVVENTETINQNDITISANSSELSINSKLLIKNKTDYSEIKTNYTPSTEEESLKDKDQFKTRAVDSQEKTVYPKTIYNKNMEITKDTVSGAESDNELPVNEKCKLLKSEELSQNKVEQDQIQAAEEAQDLEDGEVSDDNGDSPLKVPVCRFYVRNGCNWGNNCRFRHPGSNKKGNYVMFENKVLPVVNNPLPRAWTPSIKPAFPFNLSNVNTDCYYPQDQPDVSKRAPLVPTPSFKEILLTHKNNQKLGDLHRSVPSPDKPKQIRWKSRLSSGSPCSTNVQWSPAKIRSPSISPPRYANQVHLEVRSTLSSKPSTKRYRLPSPPRTSTTRIRGPRTPPCSPPVRPSAKIQTAPKRQRLYTYLSSSTDSSCTSTSESSEESLSSSDSDKEYWSRSSRRINQTKPFRAPAKSSTRPSIECTPRPSRRQETSDINRASRHTSKSKSRKPSSRTIKKSSPERDPERVPTRASRKPICERNISCPGRREYLLMKLLQVEEQIAKKKKKMNIK